MTNPKNCTQQQFIQAQISGNAIDWRKAGNGESFKVQEKDSLTVYARTGNQYWTFTVQHSINHAAIMAAIYEVLAQEREEYLEAA